jgi:outer membrane lipoprotein-sorting protein
MNKYLFSIFISIISIVSLNAQETTDAQKLIKDLLSTISQEALQTDFELKIIPKNNVNSQSVSGQLTMRGQQFYLVVEDIKVWFDGKTQWAFFGETNEVSITHPTEEELAETNPMVVLANYAKDSKLNYSKLSNSQLHVIEMTALKGSMQVEKVTIYLSKKENQLHAIKILNKDGSRNETSLKNYKKNIPILSTTFTFNKVDFPGVLINDLR